MKRSVGAALFAAALLLPRPAPAGWTGDEDKWSTDLGGSFRSVGALFQNYDEPALFGEGNDYDGLSWSVLRFTLDGGREDLVDFEAHLVQDLTWSSRPGPAVGPLTPAPPAGRYRAVDASWEWIDTGDWTGRLTVDRLNVRFDLAALDVTLGRQAITFSQAYFWNPLDVFYPFDPAAFDRDYKPGVDALRIDLALGAFSGLTLVAAPGREIRIDTSGEGAAVEVADFSDESWYGSALLLRGRTNLREWDVTLQGGKVYGGWQAGAGFSGDLWELGLRGEASWFTPSGGRTILVADGESPNGFREEDLLPEHFAAVIGFDHRFDNDLHFGFEYLYNGAGDDFQAGLWRMAVGETLSLGKHLAGTEVSYEFHPLLSGHLSWIYSFSDSSSLVSPVFTLSLSDESDLILGSILGFGERPAGEEYLELQSEFGSYANVYFAEFKVYF